MKGSDRSLDAEKPHGYGRPVLVAVVTTLVVAGLARALPEDFSATGIGLAFLAATYLLVLRSGDDATVRRFGLPLAGLLEREPLRAKRLARDTLAAVAQALAAALVVLPPFWIGFYYWYQPRHAFDAASLAGLGPELLGQVLVIALPEEAFYRGYLQTRLDDAFGTRWQLLGARVGPSLLFTSLLFAAGHLATEYHPARLAVFFPSLLFGWMRARTGSIGSAVALHAACNLFASYLTSSYGLGG